jgi:protein subunit release factor A
MFLFNNETITLEHTLFDVAIWDAEEMRIKEVVTDEEILEAKTKKAEFLIEQGQITRAEEAPKTETKGKAGTTTPPVAATPEAPKTETK